MSVSILNHRTFHRSRMLKRILCVALMTLALLTNRSKSVTNKFNRELESYDPQCDISTITLPDQPIIPVYAASYPGSGSQMTHYLYEALTGIEAGSAWQHRGDTFDRITLKTHYPVRNHRVEGGRLMHRVILQMRNPMHAIPSYYNFLYEEEYELPNHTVRAPEKSWIKWRDLNFDMEIENWKKQIIYWMDNYTKLGDRLVISYERLTDDRMGPVETARIANFLGRTEGVEIVSSSSLLPCIWDKVVNYHRVDVIAHDSDDFTNKKLRKLTPASRGKPILKRRVKYISPDDPAHPGKSLRKGKANCIFSRPQLTRIHSVLNELRRLYLGEYTLVIILNGYIDEVDKMFLTIRD